MREKSTSGKTNGHLLLALPYILHLQQPRNTAFASTVPFLAQSCNIGHHNLYATHPEVILEIQTKVIEECLKRA